MLQILYLSTYVFARIVQCSELSIVRMSNVGHKVTTLIECSSINFNINLIFLQTTMSAFPPIFMCFFRRLPLAYLFKIQYPPTRYPEPQTVLLSGLKLYLGFLEKVLIFILIVFVRNFFCYQDESVRGDTKYAKYPSLKLDFNWKCLPIQPTGA